MANLFKVLFEIAAGFAVASLLLGSMALFIIIAAKSGMKFLEERAQNRQQD